MATGHSVDRLLFKRMSVMESVAGNFVIYHEFFHFMSTYGE